MILTVDIGNSNIVIGGVRDDEILFEARLRTESTKTSDEYCLDVKSLMDVYGVNTGDVEGAIIASVVPQVLNSFQTAIKKLTGKTALVVGPGLQTLSSTTATSAITPCPPTGTPCSGTAISATDGSLTATGISEPRFNTGSLYALRKTGFP